MKIWRSSFLFVLTLALVFFISPLISVFWSLPAQAVCVTVLGREVCHQDLDPTRPIPGSADFAERAWGEAGSVAYQASARIMRERNGSGQGLDETQKQLLRLRFGGLVDQVSVIYGSRMMSEWCALGKCVNLGGVDSAAQTYCDRIYVSNSYRPNDTDQLVLLTHEIRHSQQCRERGGEGSFGFHYFREYKRAGQNYATNSMEVDAENTARDFTRNVICTQVGCTRSVQHYPNYNGWGIDLPATLPARSARGYFDDGRGVFYSNGSSYCGFASPGHLQFFRRVNSAPDLGRRDSNNGFGEFTGACVAPSGYFDDGAGVFYSAGNGTFCAFPNPEALASHRRSRPGFTDFGRVVGADRFMRYTGACQ
ncbi:hypothetical protein [Leptolyngbya ohadii]|uniref:hypothetical protein n=1 Tax=Leptolyngbya ohadii TaxID=1962290 RepID=UPI0019D4EB6A|nr:hypothetical protein [Leptolyngbya ohadii]